MECVGWWWCGVVGCAECGGGLCRSHLQASHESDHERGRVLGSLTRRGGLHHISGAHSLAIRGGHLLALHQLAKQRTAGYA